MLIGWDGKVHRVQNYGQRNFCPIQLVDVNNINATQSEQVYKPMYRANIRNFKSNLADNETGTIRLLTRATGHDSRYRNCGSQHNKLSQCNLW